MTEDADGPQEPTRSDGTDESASDREDESAATDAATNGAGEGEVEPAEGGTDPAEAEADKTELDSDAGDDEDEANSATDADEGTDSGGDAADGDDDGDDGVVVDRRSPYSDDTDDAAADDTDGAEGSENGEIDDSADDPAEDVSSGPADDGSPGQESRIEEVEPPDEPVPDATARDAPPEPPGGFPEEDEELTAAEKGMQTVENVGNALGGGGEGPESDQEMPLTAHIEEMMRRLSAVFAVAAIVSGLVLFVGSVSPAVPSAAELIRYFWDFHVGLPSSPGADDGYSPYVYGPLEYLLTKLKVVGLAGLLAGLPIFVYQTYRFMRPGLYPHERRYYLAAVPTSLVLGIVGAAFAHFAVLPFVFDYFISYTVGTAELAFGLKETFNLILIMMGYFAIVFQIPLFIQLAIMMGVVTRQWLEDRRLIFWGAFLGLALTFITVDPTGFAPIIVVATMIVLFEGTLALLRWTGN